MTFGLEVVEERRDDRRVEVLQSKVVRRLAGQKLNKSQQQTECVTIRGHSARTGLALVEQTIREKRLQRWRERAHGCTSSVISRRHAAKANNSGEADRYQYVKRGSRWPRYVDSQARRDCVFSPLRYQVAIVRTANECRRSWMRGWLGDVAPIPATLTSA